MLNPNNSDQASGICLLSQLVWALAKKIEKILASSLNPKEVNKLLGIVAGSVHVHVFVTAGEL